MAPSLLACMLASPLAWSSRHVVSPLSSGRAGGENGRKRFLGTSRVRYYQHGYKRTALTFYHSSTYVVPSYCCVFHCSGLRSRVSTSQLCCRSWKSLASLLFFLFVTHLVLNIIYSCQSSSSTSAIFNFHQTTEYTVVLLLSKLIFNFCQSSSSVVCDRARRNTSIVATVSLWSFLRAVRQSHCEFWLAWHGGAHEAAPQHGARFTCRVPWQWSMACLRRNVTKPSSSLLLTSRPVGSAM